MEEILKNALKQNLPIILPQTKEILEQILTYIKPKQILEIGSAIGYSASVMLNASKNSHLITLEKNTERYNQCKNNLMRVAGNRATCLNLDAQEYLLNATKQNKKFDFVFMDGPKGQYLNYVKLIENLLNKNAIIVCDNVYFHGMVNGKTNVTKGVRTMVRNLQKFNEYMLHNKSFETQILEKGDGILIAKYVK